MYQATADVLGALVFYPDRAVERVNEDYGATTELADELQRDENVPFRVGHHFASELVTFGRANNLKPAQLPYAEAQRIYTKAANDFHLSQTKLPLSETQFRRALTAENMVQSAEPLGGPQLAEVERRTTAAYRRSGLACRDTIETRGGCAGAGRRACKFDALNTQSDGPARSGRA